MTARELAWILVPALGLEYRLRGSRGPDACHAILVRMGLLQPGSGEAPVPEARLLRLLNRAALPETELLVPEPAPLPEWLWRGS